MLGGHAKLNEHVLAQVKNPRQRAALAGVLDDADRALADQLRREANARDQARNREHKTKPAASKKKEAKG